MAHLKKSACVLAFVWRLRVGDAAFPKLAKLEAGNAVLCSTRCVPSEGT